MTERKFSSLCRRYVTPCTEEADINFRNVALFLCDEKPMSGRDLERFEDKPRWFEFRVVSGFRAQVLPPMLDSVCIQVFQRRLDANLARVRRRQHRATDSSMRTDRVEHRTVPS